MATVTRTLTAAQATAVRRHLITMEYARAAERLAEAIGGPSMNTDDGIAGVRAARTDVESVADLVEVFGWADEITEPIEVEVDEDLLRDWAVSAFDSAREDLGQTGEVPPRLQLAADQALIGALEGLLPLIESLEHGSGAEAA